jgi:activator of HSP90 ATPase
MIHALTRRRVAGALAAAIGSIAAAPAGALARQAASAAKTATTANPDRTSLHQEIDLNGAPQRVFEILLDSKQFGAVTGMAAEIDAKEGEAFKTFGGLIEGRNIELIPGHRIVQAWRESSWEPGFYSLVHFELGAQGAATRLVLDHTGFHPGDFVHLDPGWHERYWEPLKKYLAARG